MPDVCISDPVKVIAYDPLPMQEANARALHIETVALRLLVGIAARPGEPRQPWQMVNEAFDLAVIFLRRCDQERSE